MFKYGFEVEGFAFNINNRDVTTIPPKNWPVDGFPGLVEIRTTGGQDLYKAYSDLYQEILKLDMSEYSINFGKFEHRFEAKEISLLRKDRDFSKERIHVQNLYGKDPKNLNGRTLASLQINISDVYSEERTSEDIVDGKIKKTYYPVRYNQLDIGKIVRNLDLAFAQEIRTANRQPGVYAIKEGFRLEYRSLPNTVFDLNVHEGRKFLTKIKQAVED